MKLSANRVTWVTLLLLLGVSVVLVAGMFVQPAKPALAGTCGTSYIYQYFCIDGCNVYYGSGPQYYCPSDPSHHMPGWHVIPDLLLSRIDRASMTALSCHAS